MSMMRNRRKMKAQREKTGKTRKVQQIYLPLVAYCLDIIKILQNEYWKESILQKNISMLYYNNNLFYNQAHEKLSQTSKPKAKGKLECIDNSSTVSSDKFCFNSNCSFFQIDQICIILMRSEEEQTFMALCSRQGFGSSFSCGYQMNGRVRRAYYNICWTQYWRSQCFVDKKFRFTE
ncbi:hypothetical protein FGO68_gene7375 [Halteria grandinella]|uniref:Uncharacterized protein n=1 Tax=Halteria grandinella TaxID=5974 RepID=A0A8J8SWX3_HALGN|nr:hypothetical protein FGO68_gene7375 [Halteria grandinella]